MINTKSNYKRLKKSQRMFRHTDFFKFTRDLLELHDYLVEARPISGKLVFSLLSKLL